MPTDHDIVSSFIGVNRKRNRRSTSKSWPSAYTSDFIRTIRYVVLGGKPIHLYITTRKFGKDVNQGEKQLEGERLKEKQLSERVQSAQVKPQGNRGFCLTMGATGTESG